MSGQNVLVEIEYRTESAARVSGVNVAIGFWSTTGQLMFECSTEAVGFSTETMSPHGVIGCVIPHWPLSAGLYHYNLYSTVRGVLSDWIREAGFVEVESGDFFGTGKVPAHHHQSVFVEHSWRSSGLDYL